MELSESQKELQVEVQVKTLYQKSCTLEEALDHWGVDLDGIDSFDEVVDALSAAINYSPEDIREASDYEEDEIESIEVDGNSIY